jgi:glycosyltransferase involved in cell wall biosynthesis
MSVHVLVLLENEPYPHDRRVVQEAEALSAAGYRVTVLGPTGFGFNRREEMIDGIRVLRYGAPPGGTGFLGYVREYGLAMLRLGRLAARVGREDRVDLVLVCCPPDFLILLALPFAWRGARVVFDHHDPSPELYERKFGHRGPLRRLLLTIERFTFRRADVVLAVNDTCAELARKRGGVPADRVFVVRQGPDPDRFFPVEPQPELRRGRRYLVVWIGMLTQPARVARLIEAADELVNRRGRDDIAFALVGPGDSRASVRAEVDRLGLADAVELPGRVDDDLLRAYVATADVCVSVDERSEMNDLATTTKVLDYMAMGRPVVQFPLTEMERLCGDTTAYASDGDARDLADKLEALLADGDRRSHLGVAARRRVLDGLMWPAQVPRLLAAVETALGGSSVRSTR